MLFLLFLNCVSVLIQCADARHEKQVKTPALEKASRPGHAEINFKAGPPAQINASDIK
jgi:hypothetical protein